MMEQAKENDDPSAYILSSSPGGFVYKTEPCSPAIDLGGMEGILRGKGFAERVAALLMAAKGIETRELAKMESGELHTVLHAFDSFIGKKGGRDGEVSD